MEILSTYSSQLIITGDFNNIHLENPTLSESARFLDLLSQFGLIQHVAAPTHVAEGWLDVVKTREDCSISYCTTSDFTLESTPYLTISLVFSTKLPSSPFSPHTPVASLVAGEI